MSRMGMLLLFCLAPTIAAGALSTSRVAVKQASMLQAGSAELAKMSDAAQQGLEKVSDALTLKCDNVCVQCVDDDFVFVHRGASALHKVTAIAAVAGVVFVGAFTGGVGFLVGVPFLLGLALVGPAWLVTKDGCPEVKFQLPSGAQWKYVDLAHNHAKLALDARLLWACAVGVEVSKMPEITPAYCTNVASTFGCKSCSSVAAEQQDVASQFRLSQEALIALEEVSKMNQCASLKKDQGHVTKGVRRVYPQNDYHDVYAECFASATLCGGHSGVKRIHGNPVIVNVGFSGKRSDCSKYKGDEAQKKIAARRPPKSMTPATACVTSWYGKSNVKSDDNKCAEGLTECGKMPQSCGKFGGKITACVNGATDPEGAAYCLEKYADKVGDA